MKKITAILIGIFLVAGHSYAQVEQGNVLYIVDSIPVIEDPQPGNDIIESDIADLTIIKNKDTLKLLGYEKLDGVIFIFTKEYRNRSAALKQIPSSRQMDNKNGTWYFRGSPYTGKVIDYYRPSNSIQKQLTSTAPMQVLIFPEGQSN